MANLEFKRCIIHHAVLLGIPILFKQPGDLIENLSCCSIRHKSNLILYHSKKLHPTWVYIRVRKACEWCLQVYLHYRFLFSTSATSSSVENWPLTTMIKFLMTSSEQSTSRSPPTTAGMRLGFTWNKPPLLKSVISAINNPSPIFHTKF